jgi:histidine triad (HIT) family protein
MEKSGDEVKQQCIFCQIIEDKVSSKKVYEDEHCLAILDINPANPGHVLLMPKEHHSVLPLMPEALTAHLFNVARRISQVQISVLKADGTNIFAANGAAAGQRSPHAMIHIIPRKEKDNITVFNLPKNEMSLDNAKDLKDAITAKMTELFSVGGK